MNPAYPIPYNILYIPLALLTAWLLMATLTNIASNSATLTNVATSTPSSWTNITAN